MQAPSIRSWATALWPSKAAQHAGIITALPGCLALGLTRRICGVYLRPLVHSRARYTPHILRVRPNARQPGSAVMIPACCAALEGHNAVAHDLIDGACIAMHRCHQ